MHNKVPSKRFGFDLDVQTPSRSFHCSDSPIAVIVPDPDADIRASSLE